MDPVFGIMLDVARIVTFQSSVANTETRRIARERELGSTDAVEFAPTATQVTKREQVRRSRWFRFSYGKVKLALVVSWEPGLHARRGAALDRPGGGRLIGGPSGS